MPALSSRVPQGLANLTVEVTDSDNLVSRAGNGAPDFWNVPKTPESNLISRSGTGAPDLWNLPKTPETPSEFRERIGRVMSLKNPHATSAKGFAAAVAYTVSSCSMILVNKLVLSGYLWQAPCSLMLYQNALVSIVVLFLRAVGAVPADPINLKMCRIWLPVNAIFVAMLVTSFCALQYLQVAMSTILKNCTNVLTAVGECYLTQVQHDLRVWGSLLLMILSAVCAGYTDLSFHPAGYMWQGFNCCLTAAYSLVLRHSMGAVREVTPNNAPLGEFTMVLLNSLLSLPFGVFLAVALGEWEYIAKSPLLMKPDFWVAITLSGFLGLAISFSSLWCLHMTSPTTHGLIGSLNKIPLALLGILIFRAPTTISNLSSISVGLLGGVLFAQAKMRQRGRESAERERYSKVDLVEALHTPPSLAQHR